MHLLYTVNVPIIAYYSVDYIQGYLSVYQCNLLYTVNVPQRYRWTIFRVTSAYTNASTLYGECTYYRWTIFRVTSAYIIASTLYGELMHLAIIAGLYQGYLSVYQCIYFIR